MNATDTTPATLFHAFLPHTLYRGSGFPPAGATALCGFVRQSESERSVDATDPLACPVCVELLAEERLALSHSARRTAGGAIVLRDDLAAALTTLHGERERVTADSFCEDCQKPLSAHTKCSGCEHYVCDCICDFLRDEWPTHHANPDADGERSGRVTA